ncbi:hypothetical protein NIES2119_17855 [[Phormidium ambiguum] IAM M-71]|uniref:Uncharacterized protein n=1 Tax=[Phormidium ambiguum] IAM M-71 TaxID=454136 RepID=A0A1U7IGP5_9CYAN|nr:hypothetical protein [Phormidium ambiguum]OKH36180.1 hypothetical protein NIES2119_17855 [Phormidium ambiguum IAM M-71]
MQVISITDLTSLVNPTRLAVPIDTEQQYFQLAMKQTCMKLPTEPLLVAHPQIDRWMMEIGVLFPEVFEWEPPQFLVDTQFIAKLCTNEKDVWVQINTNAAFLKNRYVNIIEWTIRLTVLNWSDKVKMWVTAESLSLPPENLKLTILALHPTHPGKKHEISWDSQQHEETRDWLMSVLAGQTAPVTCQVRLPRAIVTPTHFDIKKIAEVEI